MRRTTVGPRPRTIGAALVLNPEFPKRERRAVYGARVRLPKPHANLRETLRDATVVAVASRPSTIALADDVLYLADGQIVAHGSHDELLAEVPEYRRLMEAFEQDRAEDAEEFLS